MRPGLLSAQGLILDAMKDVEAMSGHSEHLVQSKPPVDTRHHLAGAHLSIVPLTGEPQSEPPRGPARRRRLSQGRGRFKITRSAVAEPREPDPIEIDLLSLVAHQLVTPLTLIDSAAQRMIRQAETLEPGEVKMRAGRIRTAADQLSTLFNPCSPAPSSTAAGSPSPVRPAASAKSWREFASRFSPPSLHAASSCT